MKKRIVFNADETIAENAKRNDCSISSVYRFLQAKGISKRELNNQRRSKQVLRLADNHSTKYISKRLKVSPSTVQRAKKRNVSKVDKPNLDNIQSFSFSQDEILLNISTLYLNNEQFEADLTYSVGNFYNLIRQPLLKFDKYPQNHDVKPLSEAECLGCNSLNSIIIDLPFLIQTEDNLKWHLKIPARFGSFRSENELFDANRYMISLAYRLLTRNGVLVIKTQNTRKFGRLIAVHQFVISYALGCGFKFIDEFVRLHSHSTKNKGFNNFTSRTTHCYFLVFKK